MTKLTLQQITALTHISMGATYEEAARLSNTSVSSIERWKRDPEFQEQMVSLSYDALAHVKSRIHLLMHSAIDTVQEILSDPEARPPDRLKAAELAFKFDISEALKVERVTTEREIKSIRRESL